MISKEKLPEELDTVLNGNEFDDEAGILIESISFIENDLYLTFSIRFDGYIPRPNQLWEVIVYGVEEERIVRNWTQSIEIYTDHILLLEFKDIHTELYLSGTCGDSQLLFIQIFQALTSLSSNINHLSKYIFTPERVLELSQQGHGLFARGPKSILNVYAQCLKNQGIKPIFIGEYAPSDTDKSLKLLKIGGSYFIGQSFKFIRKK